MKTRVLIIGGYGNFGSYIAKALATDENIQLVIAGRSLEKAQAFAHGLPGMRPSEAVALDIEGDLLSVLQTVKPAVVIHTTGPFQTQDYRVALACIARGCHYIDLADARRFVCGIGALDAAAKERDVLILSGASSVPCLTAAIVDDYLPQFSVLQSLDYGISAAQQTNRGLATASAVLSYVGKPISTLKNGAWCNVFGWQDIYAIRYPSLGWRLFGNCEIPDLDLFPSRYPSLQNVRFAAGNEIKLLHLATWALSWLVRGRLVGSLSQHAGMLLKMAFMFDWMGSAKSGFHMFLDGLGPDGRPLKRRFYIIAKSGHGPYIPCMPAILLARKFALGQVAVRGARPCLDLIDLKTYLAALKGLDISVVRSDTADA